MRRELLEDVKRRLALDPAVTLSTLRLLDNRRLYQRQANGFLVCHHGERTPSCSVQVRGGSLLFRCHACGDRGDILDLAAQCLGFTPRRELHALVTELAALFGWWDVLEEIETRNTDRRERVRLPPPIPQPVADDEAPISASRYDALAAALAEACPHMGPDARGYLEGRGLHAYAMAAGVLELPCEGAGLFEVLESRGLTLDELERASLAWKGGRLAFPEWRLAIPWRDEGGTVSVVQRRVLPRPGEPPREPKYRFPRGFKPRDPFGADIFTDAMNDLGAAPVVFVEGALDTLARRKLASLTGERCVVLGIPSASTFLPAWTRFGAGRDVLLAFDADKAGDEAIQRFAPLFSSARTLTRERPPFGAKDWGDALARVLRGEAEAA
jgi:hypothetical protein